MPIIDDLVVEARRILGDTDKTSWSDPRMLDIVNAGIRDINKFTGAYRSEYVFELQNHKYRYPLPRDLLRVTSIWHDGNFVPLIDRYDNDLGGVQATKSQININVLEMVGLPAIKPRLGRFFQAPILFIPSNTQKPLWQNDVWNDSGEWADSDPWGEDPFVPTVNDEPYVPDVITLNQAEGVAVNPVEDLFGVSDDLALPRYNYTMGPRTTYGLLGTAMPRDKQDLVKLRTSGNTFGILTGISVDPAFIDGRATGELTGVNERPIRIVGQYGIVTSVLKKTEYVKVRYRAVPHKLVSLDMAFPMSPSLEDTLVNWIVGTALVDDNDANNAARSERFLARYTRDLNLEQGNSATDYAASNKKNKIRYHGGIAK